MLTVVWISVMYASVLLSLSYYDLEVEGKQLLLFCLARHGDRSPIYELPGEPFAEFWENGYGQLTSVGAKQLITLGRFVRSAYGTLIPKKYHKDKFYFRSSDTDRTLMSANSFMQGLYDWKVTSSDYISPPVHSIPTRDDHLLKMSSYCPVYTRTYTSFMQSKAVGESIADYGELKSVFEMAFPSLFTGEMSNAYLIHSLSKICDSVLIWFTQDEITNPAWLTNTVKQRCSDLLDYKHTVAYSTPDLTRLRGGPLVGHILQLMQARAEDESSRHGNQQPSKRRNQLNDSRELDAEDLVIHPYTNHGRKHRLALVAYFAHDSTLSAVMSHLGIHFGKNPPLASSLLIELHQHISEKDLKREDSYAGEQSGFSLVFRYRNDTKSSTSKPLWPPMCGPQTTGNYFCPLTKLQTALAETYSTNPTVECSTSRHFWSLPGSSSTDSPWSSVDYVCYYPQILFVLALQTVLVVYILCRLRLPVLSH